MKNKQMMLFMAGVALIGLLVGVSYAAAGGGLKAPEEEIVIKGTKKSAKFSHPKHLNMGVACGKCHHDAEHQSLTDKDIGAMENSNPLRCASCHNKDFANDKLQTQKAIFHARCKECHKQGVDGKKGPTKCTGCHIKKQ